MPGAAQVEPIRRISDTGGYDNYGFESPRRRVSMQEHVEVGPVRKKSILHNAQNSQTNTNENSCYETCGPIRVTRSILHNGGDGG